MNREETTCDDVHNWIDERTPGTPEIPTDHAIATHLEYCMDCQQYDERARVLDRKLAGWEVPAPRVNIQARVMASIARKEQKRARRRRPLDLIPALAQLLSIRVRVPAYALAAAVIVLVASLTWNVAGPRQATHLAGDQRQSITAVANTPATGAQPLLITPETRVVQTSARTPGATLVDTVANSNAANTLRAGQGLVPVLVILGAPPSPANTAAQQQPGISQAF